MRTLVTDHWPTLLWSSVVATLLLAPAGVGAPAPLWLERFEAAGGDKLIHAALFFVQAVALARTFSRAGVAAGGLVAAAAVATAYGIGLELLQLLVDGRGFEVADALADAAGAIGGASAARLLRQRR